MEVTKNDFTPSGTLQNFDASRPQLQQTTTSRVMSAIEMVDQKKKKQKKKMKKLDDKEKLDVFEEENKQIFTLIDQMHLENLDERMVESQNKFKDFITNLQDHREKLLNRQEQITQRIGELHEEDEQSLEDQTEKPKTEKEYQTSSMIEVPGELPKMIKRVVKNSDMNLSKIKELLQTQRQLVDSLQNSIREIVSKINPQALGVMNVKGKQPLEELFQLLFELLYSEQPDKFVWKEFKYTALMSEDGSADFLYRLANYDIKKISPAMLEKIKKNKDSNELRSYLEDPKIGELIIEIADWLEFIYHGNSLMNELAEIEELYADAKETVELQERKQRKHATIENLKQQRIQEIQNQHDFVGFIQNVVGQMRSNYQMTSDKLKNHITYQSEVIAALNKQGLPKSIAK